MKTEIQGHEAIVMLTEEEIDTLNRARDLWAAIDRRAQSAWRQGGIKRVSLAGDGPRRVLIGSLADFFARASA